MYVKLVSSGNIVRPFETTVRPEEEEEITSLHHPDTSASRDLSLDRI